MERFYLRYRLTLEAPTVMSDGSQIGNLLKTHDHIPGSAVLGHCAGLYLRESSPYSSGTTYTNEFRELFLSSKTLYSPAYPMVHEIYRTFPMPLSVLGCKHFGSRDPEAMGQWAKREEQHGFEDCLHRSVPPTCPHSGCDSPVDHKSGFCYHHSRYGYCNADVLRSIIPHNEFAETEEDKNVYFYESLSEGQLFYGEIAFSSESCLDIINRLLRDHPVAKFGKAKFRGHGKAVFYTPVRQSESLLKEWKIKTDLNSGPCFSIYLFSDAILVDDALNYRSALNGADLARSLNLPDTANVRVHLSGDSPLKSFFKAGKTMGFNQHRGMPLSLEATIAKGSVFSVSHHGKENIGEALQALEREGIGIRRNEGYGRIIINHAIHGSPPEALYDDQL